MKWNRGKFGFWFFTRKTIALREKAISVIFEAQGRTKERQRIIETLEKDICQSPDEKNITDGMHWAIALIKGEVK
jgi:hypothetical protein